MSLFGKENAGEKNAHNYLRFNLLPEEYTNRHRRLMFSILRVALLVCLIAAVGLLFFNRVRLLWEYQNRADQARTAVADHREDLKLKEQLDDARRNYRRRQEEIQRVTPAVEMHSVLRDVADSVPDLVMLSDLSVRSDEGVQAAGVAPNLRAVSDFAVNVNDLPYLKRPVVTFPREFSSENPEPPVVFSITASWEGKDDGS